jgi:hypothetical protein
MQVRGGGLYMFDVFILGAATACSSPPIGGSASRQ